MRDPYGAMSKRRQTCIFRYTPTALRQVPHRHYRRWHPQESNFMRTVLIGALALIVVVAGTAYAETRPAIPRVGKSCPTGYYKSGEYCVQNR